MNKQMLIEAISVLPELYDKSHKNYGSIDHRNQVWESLAEKFGLSVEIVRNKWRNIRDAYQKALKKKAQCIDNNTMELYKAYKYEDQMKFLIEFCSATTKGVKRKSTSRDERIKSKQKESGFFYKIENDEYIQEIYENEEDQKTILESDLQEDPEELKTCVQFEEQKEDEQSVQSEDPNNLETELFYEEFSEEVKCKVIISAEDETVLESTKCKSKPIISVSKEANEASKIAMSNFFLTVCNTVSTLPILLQAKIKKQVFDIVSEAEISYLTEQSIHK